MKDTTSKASKMEERKLLSMVDYVEWIKFEPLKTNYKEGAYPNAQAQRFGEICNYANFLQTELNISMFVPAILKDGKWEVLEIDIERFEKWLLYEEHGFEMCFSDEEELKQYQTAKQNVIFEGFEAKVADWCDELVYELHSTKVEFELNFEHDANVFIDVDSEVKFKTIGDLVNLTLTEIHHNKCFK